MVEGVFFDLGGTLFSYRNVGHRSAPLLIEACTRMGLNVSAEQIGKAYQQAGRELSKTYGGKGYYLHADLFKDTFNRFCELVNGEFSADVYGWYRHEQHNAVLSGLHLKDDCHSTLAELKSRGLYLSIVSNIDDDMLNPLVEREGLDVYFDHWTSSEAAASCKPDPVVFEFSLAKSNLLASSVLFVGDSPEHDVLGASRMGMRTVLIVEEGIKPPLQSGKETVAADHEISSLRELTYLVNG